MYRYAQETFMGPALTATIVNEERDVDLSSGEPSIHESDHCHSNDEGLEASEPEESDSNQLPHEQPESEDSTAIQRK